MNKGVKTSRTEPWHELRTINSLFAPESGDEEFPRAIHRINLATDAHGWSRIEGRLAELTCRRAKVGMVERNSIVNITTIVTLL